MDHRGSLFTYLRQPWPKAGNIRGTSSGKHKIHVIVSFLAYQQHTVLQEYKQYEQLLMVYMLVAVTGW